MVSMDGSDATGLLLDQVVAGRRGIWKEAVALLAGLAGSTPQVALQAVEASRHEEPAVRARMARALRDMRSDHARRRLQEMRESDPDPKVRRAAGPAPKSVVGADAKTLSKP
jgi:hypothetical protein